MKCKKCGNELHGLQKCPFCGTTQTVGAYGRIRRSVYWAMMLPCVLVGNLCLKQLLEAQLLGEAGVVWWLVLFPVTVVEIRAFVGRLHDLDKSGWWWLVLLVPVVGSLVAIVVGCLKGTPGPNRFGGDPHMQYRRSSSSAVAGHGAGSSFCHECGHRMEAGAKFCPHCGKAVPKRAKCRKCGGELDAGQQFCPKCGMSVDGGTKTAGENA